MRRHCAQCGKEQRQQGQPAQAQARRRKGRETHQAGSTEKSVWYTSRGAAGERLLAAILLAAGHGRKDRRANKKIPQASLPAGFY
jgi:hypothetical protein